MIMISQQQKEYMSKQDICFSRFNHKGIRFIQLSCFPCITFKNEHSIYKQQISKLFDSLRQFSMSQALENKEGSEKNQQGLCVKCQGTKGSDNFQKLCANCLNQTKAQEESMIKQSEKKVDEKVEFTTPTKCVKHEITIQRQKQLIEAPRKQRLKRYQPLQSEETQRNQETDMAQIQKYNRKRLDRLRQRLQEIGQCEQKILQQSDNEEPILQNEASLVQNCHKQQNKLDDINSIAAKIKRRGSRFYQSDEAKDQQLKPKKRTHQEMLETNRTIKGRCSFCKKKTGLLGIGCSHCSLEFCNSHRLPEDHDCKIDFSQNARVKMRAMISSILPKHKGKIPEI